MEVINEEELMTLTSQGLLNIYTKSNPNTFGRPRDAHVYSERKRLDDITFQMNLVSQQVNLNLNIFGFFSVYCIDVCLMCI
jgi:hypothetical protein